MFSLSKRNSHFYLDTRSKAPGTVDVGNTAHPLTRNDLEFLCYFVHEPRRNALRISGPMTGWLEAVRCGPDLLTIKRTFFHHRNSRLKLHLTLDPIAIVLGFDCASTSCAGNVCCDGFTRSNVRFLCCVHPTMQISAVNSIYDSGYPGYRIYSFGST